MMGITIYYGIVNIISFVVYGIDKKRAEDHKWRVSEKALLTLAAAGGALGALLGMNIFRHKTRKIYFRILVPLFLIIHIGIIFWLNRELFT